jgi:hypothetical protein
LTLRVAGAPARGVREAGRGYACGAGRAVVRSGLVRRTHFSIVLVATFGSALLGVAIALAFEPGTRVEVRDDRLRADTRARPRIGTFRPPVTAYALSPDGRFIARSDGARIRVVEGRMDGYVELAVEDGDAVQFAGWAADVVRGSPADRVVVFADGRSAYVGSTGAERKDVAASVGSRFRNAGFVLRVPRARLVDGAEKSTVRVFALARGVAAELKYLSGASAWAGNPTPAPPPTTTAAPLGQLGELADVLADEPAWAG